VVGATIPFSGFSSLKTYSALLVALLHTKRDDVRSKYHVTDVESPGTSRLSVCFSAKSR
jgi:hypothetical protein